jgi:hypothetical protein
MAKTTRQTAIFGAEDWKKLYRTYKEADFQSYDFETLRKSMVDYLRLYYPETFNDYTESSEFVALLDLMAFMGQGLAFRNDLNTRENFLDTAERRDSVTKLAKLVGYTPKRNLNGNGFLKVTAVSTTESVLDYNNFNLSGITINWNDVTNPDWLEQFNAIMNASMIDSQRFGRPGNTTKVLGVQTDEYQINLPTNVMPIAGFSSDVDGVSMDFEIVSGTAVDKTYVYEQSPQPDGAFNVLYKNDKLGYGSENTGYFFMFKQGTLSNQDFTLVDRISNRVVDLNVEGVNQDDVWLFNVAQTGNVLTEWREVDNIFAVDSKASIGEREVYQVNTKTNDQIQLQFGDGTFSKIPLGEYRSYIRSSNGLEYVINPEEIQNIQVPLSYVSRNGRTETLTLTVSLQTAVSNSKARENISEIKERAPAAFYTQNRMVNGEDYNNFPFTRFTSILKSKALARTGVGINRQLDLLDPTGKYSSTTAFASDGSFYRSFTDPTKTFSFVDTNDIADVIQNTVEPILKSRELTHFYYDKYQRVSLSGITWNQSTAIVNQTTGYFTDDVSGGTVSVALTSSKTKYIQEGALIKFEPPANQYFDANNRLQSGVPTKANEKLALWATVTNLVLDGTNFGQGNLANGTGPITFNEYLPTGCVPTEVIPKFVTDLTVPFENKLIDQIEVYRDFGIGFDEETSEWYIIATDNLSESADYDRSFAKNTDGLNRDASWLIQFTTDGEIYTIKFRNLVYYFASVQENRFIFDSSAKVYDPKTGKTVTDNVSVLKANTKPDANENLTTDVSLDIVGQEVETDGFVDNFKVLVSFSDKDQDGIADNPDIFKDLVNPTTSPNTKYVFFQRQTDFDNLERWVPLASNVINMMYADLDAVQLKKKEYLQGQIFYAYTDKKFYKLSITGSEFTIAETTDYRVSVGRQDLYFQYKHNSPNTRRIDPALTNIIDLYLVTNTYYTNYTNWIKDSTGKVTKALEPTIDELTLAYNSLEDYKMASDGLILNSVTFKPLFGDKASLELQGKIKVIKQSGIVVSTGEIKSRVVQSLNEYFTIDKWDFGDTFYFSELSAYLHEELGDIVSSVVIVPTDPTKTFGDLYEIRCAPNEIFVNAALVSDIEVIDALTAGALKKN